MRFRDFKNDAKNANLEVFCETLLYHAQNDTSVLAVTSDSRGSAKLGPFAEKFPNQIVEVGIAEQCLVGVAAGLASTGKKVFAVSPGSFLTARSLEQIKNDVAYSNNPVALVGISAGVSYGALGSTHHSIHDFAAFRAINNLDIFVPGDNIDTKNIITYALQSKTPCYIRFGKKCMPDLPAHRTRFEPGKAVIMGSGKDIAFISTGETTALCCDAAKNLEHEGIESRVVHMPSMKPFDTQSVISAARECRQIITVEEHMVHGGLGEACASVLMQNRVAVSFKIMGIPDEYTVSGSQMEILAHYGISGNGLAEQARTCIAALRTPA